MAKITKSKKRVKKTPQGLPVLLLVLFIGFLLVLIAAAIYFKLSSKSAQTVVKASPQPSVLAAQKIIPPKPSPKPSPKPVVIIPTQSGRAINVPMLTYHYIGSNPNPADKLRDNLSVAPEVFDEQMGYLAKNGFTPITLDTLYAGLMGKVGLPGKPIVLTFDDGYMDFYYNAYPILRKYNFHAVSFIPTGLMNRSYYLTWSQIMEMERSGLISFEAHSVNHLSLISLPPDQLKYQIIESKKILEAQLGHPVNFFAYPYGTSNALVWKAVKDAGFVGAVGSWSGTTESEGDIFDMPRIKIPGGLDIKTFASRI